MPTISDFTKTYEVQTNTIRHWAANFADFLSPGANPGKGQRRTFNQEDATVIALIGEMRQEYKSYQEITAALAAGDRGQWPPESNQAGQDGPEETQSGDNRSLALITQLTAKASSLEGELKATKAELDRRLDELQQSHEATREAEKRYTIAETKLEAVAIMQETETPAADDLVSGDGGQAAPVKLSRRQRLANWISGGG